MVKLKLVRLLSRASAEAYHDLPNLKGYTAYPLAEGSAHATLFVGKEDTILAFRGTELDSMGDLVTDALFRREGIAGIPGKWHRGFKYQLMPLYYLALPRLRAHAPDGKPLYITGRSLGGALATMFTAKAISVNEEIMVNWKETVTFGAPRAANGKAARWFDSLIGDHVTRVEIVQDIVPHLPFAFLGYRHYGEALRVDAVKSQILKPRKWWTRLSLTVALVRGARAHNAVSYVSSFYDFIASAIRRVGANEKSG